MWTGAPSSKGVQGSLPGARDLAVRLAAVFAEVERLRGRRTHVEEFYNFYDGELTIRDIEPGNRRQSLGWRSPMEYLAKQRLEEAF